MAFMFEKLEVYQRAITLADEIVELTQSFPRGFGFLFRPNEPSVALYRNESC